MAWTIQADDKIAVVTDSIGAPVNPGDNYYGALYHGIDFSAPFRAAVDAYFKVMAGRSPEWYLGGHTGAGMVDELSVNNPNGKQGGGNFGNGTDPDTLLPYYQQQVTRWGCTKLLLEIGINDMRATGDGGATTWDRTQFEARCNTYKTNCGLAGSAIMFVGPFIYQGVHPDGSNPCDTGMDDLNASISGLCTSWGATYVDVRTPFFADAANTAALLAPDNVHPTTPAGKAHFARAMWAVTTLSNAVRLTM